MDGHFDPAIERLLEESQLRRVQALSPRERRDLTIVAPAFLAAAVAMVLLLPAQRSLSPVLALVVLGAYAIAARVDFDVGGGFMAPTQLVLVPMLFLVPTSAVPLFVAAGLLLGRLPDYLAGKTHGSRAAFVLGDSWHAVGPVLVLALAGSGAPTWGDWPVYLAALGAQFGVELVTWTARDWLALGVAPRLQMKTVGTVLGWVFLVDALLTPIGLAGAFASGDHRYAFLLVMPLVGLLAIFGEERKGRIESSLELSHAYRGTALLLGDVVEGTDAYTADHSRSVVSLALDVADEIGLNSRRRREVEFAALLHDIGKITVPPEILNKPGPLTDEEWAIMQTHTLEGERMLERVGGVLREVGRIVRSSHERWDGTGYPDRLAGEQIPDAACIVSCCDAFNAMTTDRPYRDAMSIEDALEELRVNAGSQFNPAVVEVLIGIVTRAEGLPSAPARRGGRALPAAALQR